MYIVYIYILSIYIHIYIGHFPYICIRLAYFSYVYEQMNRDPYIHMDKTSVSGYSSPDVCCC